MRRSSQQGFSLLELLIVMVILGLLASLIGPTLFKKVGGAKQKTAKTQIELLSTSLDTYRLDNGDYPSSEQGLQALREQPSDLSTWDGPYLTKPVPLDPWGRPYEYKNPGDHNMGFDLYSLGKDGMEGGSGEDADVVSWE